MAYEIKTKVSNKSVEDFLENIENEQTKTDCKKIHQLMEKVTKEKSKIFGKDIIGFGLYSYESKSKCSGEWFYVGYSPKKAGISIYTMCYNNEKIEKLKQQLGKTKLGKCCISFKKIEDIDLKVLEKIIKIAYVETKKEYS